MICGFVLDIRILHLKIQNITLVVSFLGEPSANSNNDVVSISHAL